MRLMITMLFLGFLSQGFGQVSENLMFSGDDAIEIDWSTSSAATISTYWGVTNIGSMGLTLQVSREVIIAPDEVNMPYSAGGDGVYERFCWGPLCYNYGTATSSANPNLTVYIPAGTTNNTFGVDYYPNSTSGASAIRYCFFPVGQPEDAACRTATFHHIDPNEGCTDSFAVNFDPFATTNDNSCSYQGCTDPAAINFHSANDLAAPEACVYDVTCMGDLNGDNSISIADMLQFLTVFGQECP